MAVYKIKHVETGLYICDVEHNANGRYNLNETGKIYLKKPSLAYRYVRTKEGKEYSTLNSKFEVETYDLVLR